MPIGQGGTALDANGEKLRTILDHLDRSSTDLQAETKDMMRSYLAENQERTHDLQERLRLSAEEADAQTKRRAEVEKLLSRRDQAYEDLLGQRRRLWV